MKQDRWRDLCKLYEGDDGQPVREVGFWTEEKLFFWNRYIDITTGAMVGHRKWPAGLVYVDLFAGPGICRLKESGRRIPGSTLIAAHASKRFQAILSIELDASNALALESRLRQTPSASVAHVFQGDCNVVINRVVQHIPKRALTLGFIDPESLNVDFQRVKTLSQCGQVDLLILFADSMDLVRNVDRYERDSDSVLDRMMGPHSSWREKWKALANRTRENVCRLFADEYKLQLSNQLGYRAPFGEKIMKSANGPLYRLIFASKSNKGLEFWNKVTKKDRGGQLDLGF